MSDQNTFKFLVTTDNHMGYKENDQLRRKDSYMAFSEALQVARERDVDFILLGGDLFHMNRPSSSVEHKCIKIIRRHMNSHVDRGTSFERVAGKFSHFHKLNHANFEDPSLKVPYPILTIHGNHDDPTGPNAQSICEKLATCGLLNYFGALTPNPNDEIHINPIVLQKNHLKIALYGLGFIPDVKLNKLFDKGAVHFVAPPPDTYNVLVVHQNRSFKGDKDKRNLIPDEFFPPFFHLVIRGHEHETQAPEPIPDSQVGGLVYQPGSTVATSITVLESAPKKVGLFKVTRRSDEPPVGGDCPGQMYNAEWELIALKSHRRMLIKDIRQKEIFRYVKQKSGTQVTASQYKQLSKAYAIDCIRSLLKTFPPASFEDNKLSRFDLPLVRLRLEYTTKRERFDGSEASCIFFPDKVANKEIILFKKQKLAQVAPDKVENVTFDPNYDQDEDDEDETDEIDHVNIGEEKRDTIDVMIENYFKAKGDDEQLKALSLVEYTMAVRGSNEDGNVISRVLTKKKIDVMKAYRDAISNEEVAALRFHNQAHVEDWFLNAFKKGVPSSDRSFYGNDTGGSLEWDADVVMLDD